MKGYKKGLQKNIKIFLNMKKNNRNNMITNDINIVLKRKDKSCLSIEKNGRNLKKNSSQ